MQDAFQLYNWKRILLAVSGGMDSISLAHYFIQNKDALGIEWLGIAHVNHGLRDGTADRDAKFVENFANTHHVPFFLKSLDGSTLKSMDGSLEENARDARYEVLLQFARQSKAQVIATAHHAGDQAETLYLRIRRGVTLSGLRGMQQVRTFHDIFLFRPFLQTRHEELLEYATTNKLEWCEDETNNDTHFARNAIRHHALPTLEKTNPGASEQLCRLASLASHAYAKAIDSANSIFEQAVIPKEEWPFEPTLSPFSKVIALKADFFAELKDQNKFSRLPGEHCIKIQNQIPRSPGEHCIKIQNQIPRSLDSLGQKSRQKLRQNMELFRLWLDSKGFRFPIDLFAENSPIPEKFAFRTRFIEKCRHIIWIYDAASIQTPANLYFSTEKLRFSGHNGQWRHPREDDVLCPPDMKIKPRKLATWLQEKGVPRWVRPSLQVFAQESRVLFVSGVRVNRLNKG